MMFDMTLVAFWFYVIVLSHVSLSALRLWRSRWYWPQHISCGPDNDLSNLRTSHSMLTCPLTAHSMFITTILNMNIWVCIVRHPFAFRGTNEKIWNIRHHLRIYKYKFIYSLTENTIIRFGGVDLNRLDLCIPPWTSLWKTRWSWYGGGTLGKKEWNKQLFIS